MRNTFQQYCMIPGCVHIIQHDTTCEYCSIQIIHATMATTCNKDHMLYYNAHADPRNDTLKSDTLKSDTAEFPTGRHGSSAAGPSCNLRALDWQHL